MKVSTFLILIKFYLCPIFFDIVFGPSGVLVRDYEAARQADIRPRRDGSIYGEAPESPLARVLTSCNLLYH